MEVFKRQGPTLFDARKLPLGPHSAVLWEAEEALQWWLR